MKLFNFFKSNNVEVANKGKIENITFDRTYDYNYNPQYNLSNPYISRYTSSLWLPFGEDNLYPQFLLKMYNGSPFHSAIIDFKIRSIMADGLNITILDKTQSNTENKIQQKKFEQKFDRKFFKRFIQEWLIHERTYLKLKRSGENYHLIDLVPSEEVRLSHNSKDNFFWLSDDWERRVNAYKLAKYDKFNSSDEIQLLEFSEPRPGVFGYAVPSYATAANWIWLDSEIAFFQKQNIENSINPSAIIKIYESFANDEEKHSFIKNLKSNFASARNSGKVMVFASNGRDLSPDVTMAEPNKLDKSFAATQENIIRNVAYAHNINPELMGIATAGKLGTANELNEAYSLFNHIWLSSMQDIIEDNLQKLIDIISPIEVKVNIKRRSKFLQTNENNI